MSNTTLRLNHQEQEHVTISKFHWTTEEQWMLQTKMNFKDPFQVMSRETKRNHNKTGQFVMFLLKSSMQKQHPRLFSNFSQTAEGNISKKSHLSFLHPLTSRSARVLFNGSVWSIMDCSSERLQADIWHLEWERWRRLKAENSYTAMPTEMQKKWFHFPGYAKKEICGKTSHKCKVTYKTQHPSSRVSVHTHHTKLLFDSDPRHRPLVQTSGWWKPLTERWVFPHGNLQIDRSVYDPSGRLKPQWKAACKRLNTENSQ